jgi:hypothetical protein
MSTTSSQILIAPPVLSGATNTVNYDQGGAAVTVDSGLTISDASSTTLDSATVTISGVLLVGDTLAFTQQSGITGSYDPTTGLLSLSGNASLAAYQAALDSVVYSSSSVDATNGGADMTRTITWTATSAGITSSPVTSVIDIVPATGVVTTLFSGLSDSTNTPPENAFAVSSAYIVTAETTHYEITDLSGNPIVANGSLYSVFSPLGGTLDNNLLDARAAYDSSTGRFVIIVDNFQPGTGNFGTNIDIAVSKDSNPADGWYVASIDTSNGFTTQSDMPYLSVSNGNIYVSTPENLDAGGGYGTAEFVVSESAVIAAGNSAITPAASNVAPVAPGIMRNVADANGTTYYLSAHSNGSQTVLTYQTYNAASGFSSTQTLSLGNSDVGGGATDYTAAQMGTSKLLDIGDSRLQSLAYASSGGHNYIYGVSEVMPSAGSVAEIEWFQLDVTNPANPQYVNGNVISGASIGSGVAVFNPSIAVDANGDVLINFSASGPNMYPSDYYTVLGAGASAFSAPTQYQASNTFLDSGALNDQRWGTYSTAVADPNNPNGFWISNEYVTTAVNGPGGSPGWWSTANAQVQVGAAIAPPVLSGATNTVNYDEGGAAVTVDSGLTISDASSTTLDSATVTISGVLLVGDTLAFTQQSGITGSYDPTTGLLSLSGNASLAAYQAALDSVVYSSSSVDATNGGADMTRTITWTATSAGTTSLPVTSIIDIVPPPPPPNPAVVTTQFSGLSDPTGNYPPENGLAVGPSNVVMAETTNYEITNLSGGAATTASLSSLFSSLGATLDNSLLDARVAYDSSTGHYVLIADNFQPGGGNFLTNIDIAVSKDSNPADGWYVTSIDTSQGGTMQSDMPYLSVAGGNISISTPEYLDTGGLGGTGQWVLSEASVVAGSPNTVSALAPAANYIMRIAADGNGVSYYVGAHSTGSQTDLSYQTYSASGGFSTVQTIALGNSDLGPGTNDFTVQQGAGASLTLDAGDSRIESLTYANGYLWGVSEVMPSGSTAPEIHWFKLNVSNPAAPTIAAQGDISGASLGSGVGAFNASIAVDGNGDVLINFTASGPSLTPSDYYVTMAAGASVFSAATLYQSSTSYFQQTSGATGAQRWGVYSSATADPNNTNGFWISNEYVTNTGVTIPSGLTAWWSTVTAQVTIPSSASPPVLGGAGVAASYTQGGAAAPLDTGLTVSDPSSANLVGATVAITSGLLSGDTLNFTNQGAITGSYNAATGVLTLSGTATLAQYQTALDSITFSTTSLNPTYFGTDTGRAISWQVNDGTLPSAAVSTSVTVVGGSAISDSLPNIIANLAAINADTNLAVLNATSGTGTLPNGHPIATPAFTLSGSGTTLTVPWFMLYAGALTVGSGATISVTSGATVTTTGAFSAGSGATVDVSGGYLVVSGANSFSGATVTGAYTLMDTGTTSVSGLTIGGTATFENTNALTQSGGTVTVGDASGAAAILFNAKTGTYDITDDSGVAQGTSTPSLFANFGLFEKTVGTGTSTVQTRFTSTGTVTAATGTIAFSGATNNFWGIIGGAGAVSFTGGVSRINAGTTVSVASLTATGASTTLVIAGNLSYAGSFSDASGATLTIASGATLSLSGTATLSAKVVGAGSLAITGGTTSIMPSASVSVANLSVTGATTTLVVGEAFGFGHTFSATGGATLNLSGGNFGLSGANSFSDATVTGVHTLFDNAVSSVSGLTIGGTATFQNCKTLTQSGGTVTVGDSTGATAILFNAATGIYDITDNSGVARGTSTASLFANNGLFEKTGGTGTSVIAPRFYNGHAVSVSSGTLDFAGAVTGTGTDTISAGATLEFDSTVASGQTIAFSGSNNVLDLTDPTGFSGSISGFAATDTIDFAGAWSLLSVTQNNAGTTTLTLKDGAATDIVHLVGAYSTTDFNLAAGAGNTTILGHV